MRYRAILRWLLWILLCPSLLLYGSTAPARELLQDGHFSRGLMVAPLSHAQFAPAQQRCLPLRACERISASAGPAWQLQQWSTATDIATGQYTQPDAGAEQWVLQDRQQRVQKRLLLASGKRDTGDILLEIDGASEFAARSDDGVPHYLPDLRNAWPHFLLSQQLDSDRLSQYRQLHLHGEFRVPVSEGNLQSGYSRAIHAARLVLAITVRNRFTGNYFWLNLPLYDDRIADAGFGCQKCTDEADGQHCRTPSQLQDPGVWHCPEDKVGDQWWHNEKRGTARMIFRLPVQDFLASGVQQIAYTDWQVIDVDLLPYVQAGIEAVRQRHNGRSFPADLHFYELGLFSLGWEITGFNHVAAQLRNWQLDAMPHEETGR